jgi:hypothetical protein
VADIISPYLKRPLRSLEEVIAETEPARPADPAVALNRPPVADRPETPPRSADGQPGPR